MAGMKTENAVWMVASGCAGALVLLVVLVNTPLLDTLLEARGLAPRPGGADPAGGAASLPEGPYRSGTPSSVAVGIRETPRAPGGGEAAPSPRARTTPPGRVAPRPDRTDADPVAAPSAPALPASDGPDSPIRVARIAGSVRISALPSAQPLSSVVDEGGAPASLRLQGFDLVVEGPDGYRAETSHAADDEVRLDSGDLPDGLYQYSVSPRLQPLSSLPGPDPGAPELIDANGRNALDPRVIAGATVERLEPETGSFRVSGGQLVDPDREEI